VHRDEYLDHLRRDGQRIAAIADRAPDATVPTCPGWTVRDLAEHLRRVLHWLTTAGREDRSAAPDALPERPADLRAALDETIATLSTLEPDAPRWVWSSPQKATAAWYFRRVAQETLVHRLDAELAVGEVTDVDPAFAVDGVEERCDVFIPAVAGQPIGGSGQTVHLHATDAEGEWNLTLHADRVEVARGHGKGDAALRGAARDLLLQVWGRDPIGEVEVFGDESVVARFRAATKL
jgi:uncharacterized protein (TIGR03083 family)